MVHYLQDCAGLTVTCTNVDALPAYNEMLLVTMAKRQSPLSLAQSVLELDPDFTLAHCLLVGLAHCLNTCMTINYHWLQGTMWLSDLTPPSDPRGRGFSSRGTVSDLLDNLLPSPSLLPPVSVHVRAVKEAERSGDLTERERRHVQAILAFSEGDVPKATCYWADILVRHPRDLLAVAFLFASCIRLGKFEMMRNSLAGVKPHWSRDMPSYPFLLAW